MAEKKVIELDLQTNLGSLKSQLKQAQADVQTLSDKFGATSKEAIEAAKQAAILKDKIGDAKALTDAFNPDAKFKALSGSLQGVAGGFSVVTGAMGAFGVESEAVEKSLLKVQSAMALASGAQALGESIDSFKQLGAVVKTAFSSMTTASKAFLVGGIGLLITAVALLVENMDDIKNSFNKGLSAAKKYAETTEKQAEAARHAVENFDEYARTLKRVGYEEDTINKKRSATFAKAIKDTESQLKAQKKLLSESKKGLETAQAFDSFGLNATGRLLYGDEDDVKANRAKFNELSGQLEKLKNDKYFFEEQIKKDKETAKKDNDDAAKDRAKDAAEKRKEAKEQAAAEAKAKQEVIDKADADAKRLELERQQEFDNSIQDIAEQNYLNTLNDQQKEELAVQDKYFTLETLAGENKDALAEIELAKMNELNDINLKYQDLDYKQKEEARLKLAEATKKATDKEIAEAKAVAEQKAAIQMQGLDTALQGVQLIKGLFEKQKGVQKAAVIAESAIGIAKMIIANKLANVAALATPQAVASSGVAAAPVIAMNNISTGIGIAANIAATAKALRTLGGGSPPSSPSNLGGGGAGAGSVMSPNFNVVGNSGLNQLSQLQQKPTKAYVVSGDMTTAQALDRNRIENATLVQ
jgi:hypothetical protein